MGKTTRGAFDYLRKLLGVPGRKPRPPRAPRQAALPTALHPEKQRRVEELRRELKKREGAPRRVPRPPAKPKPPRPRYRRMTDNERALARALSRVTFGLATAAERFANEIGGEARSMYPLITNRQANFLRNLVHRYRRQISPSALPPEERHLLVDPKPKRRELEAV